MSTTLPEVTRAMWSGLDSTSSPAWSRFLHTADEEYVFVRTTERKTIASLREVVDKLLSFGSKALRYAELRSGGGYALIELADDDGTAQAYCYLYVDRSDREATINVAARTLSDADEFVAVVAALVPELPKMPEDIVSVRFWSAGMNGPTSLYRDIRASTWESTHGNYTSTAAHGLGVLMNRRINEGDGRIGILHGPPGTGKTTALRTLAREWKPWCDLEYVIDADQFFGSAKYMLSVLMENDASGRYYLSSGQRAAAMQRWRCVVIEDAEEFLAPEAKSQVGQALARLLNFGDGFLGQGLNVIVLMTTNAPLAKLHPAITRPGRCFSNIEVPPFKKEDAHLWLKARGIEEPDSALISKSEYSLADLYAVIRKDERVDQSPTVEQPTVGAYL